MCTFNIFLDYNYSSKCNKVIASFNNAHNNSNDLRTTLPLPPLTTYLTTWQNGTLVSAGENHTILDMLCFDRKTDIAGLFLYLCLSLRYIVPLLLAFTGIILAWFLDKFVHFVTYYIYNINLPYRIQEQLVFHNYTF